MAGCSQPGDVDADDGDVGRAAGRRDGLREPEGRAGVGDDDLVGQAGGRSSSASASNGHDADAARGPGGARRRRGRGEPDFPAAPSTATVGATPPGDVLGDDPGDEGRGAADVHDHEGEVGGEVLGQPGGDRAAEQDRRARAAGTRSERPSQRSRPSVMVRGVRERETRVATRSPAESPSGDSGPTSATVPMSMPPEPVTGFCILPRSATMARTSARTASPSPPCFSESWRKDAASRLSVSTSMRTSSGHSSGPASRTRAAWGSAAPAGSVTRCRPTGEDGVACAQESPRHPTRRRSICGRNVTWASSVRILPRMTTMIDQPYAYRRRELIEPDWTRLPGGVTSPPPSGRTPSGSGRTA